MGAASDQLEVSAPAPRFTEEQSCAILTRDVPIALSAGAGCGKTFVLTERYLSHLEPGSPDAPSPDLSRLVAFTFTDRAAREMRDRIRAKCLERLQRATSEQGDYWLRLLRSLDSARVSTIHSFCGSLLRSHAAEAGLDPRFTVLEQAQAEALFVEQIDDLLRTRLSARDEDVLELVVQFGLDRLRGVVADLYHDCRRGDRWQWLDRKPEELVDRWAEFHRQYVVPQAAREVVECEAARGLLAILRAHVFDHAEVRNKQEVLLRLLPNLAESDDLQRDLLIVREEAKVGRGKKYWPSDEIYDRFLKAAKKLRDTIDKVNERVEFDRSAALAAAQLGLALLKLVDAVARTYEAAKLELAALDFDDLIERARQLLCDSRHERLRARLAENTSALLVDECQDTDPVQAELIQALCGDEVPAAKLFLVGDFKQSIYRFRGADPTVFRRLRGDTPERGRLPLTRNFRSQPAILDFVNALFCEALAAPEMPYEPLTAQRNQTHKGAAIEFMWCLPEQPTADGDADATVAGEDQAAAKQAAAKQAAREAAAAGALRRREADWLARRICQLLAGEPVDGAPPLVVHDPATSQLRRVQPGDIAILFRSLSDVAYYEEALRNHGIDYYLVGGHAFYAQQEIYDVLNLLRSLASPADEVSVAGVLRSPFFSFSDETLFWIAQHPQGLWAGLTADHLPLEIGDQERNRVAFAAKLLGDLRDRKDRVTIAELINTALARTGYDAVLLGEFLGERKLANLRKIVGQARDFEAGGTMGLSAFIVQLSQFIVRQPREPLAATQPEATDVVRLMTIHQSKGLEFPVVFVPDLGRKENLSTRSAAYCAEWGPMLKLPDDHEYGKIKTALHFYHQMSAMADEDETRRIFYVACTRAADFLVLSSGLKKFDSMDSTCLRLLAERFDIQTGRVLATLPAGYQTPAVRVILDEPQIAKNTQAKRGGITKGIVDEIEAAGRSGPVATVRSADAIPAAVSAARRFSVSRLKGALEPVTGATSDSPSPASFAPTDDAAALGILVHSVLQTLDFGGSSDLAAEISRQADRLRLRDADTCCTALEMTERFRQSPRARQLSRAGRIFREVEFVLAWPPSFANGARRKASKSAPATGARQPALAGNGKRYLQGYLDCVYQDADGQWHVLDYKTNQVSAGRVTALAGEYEMQMLAYGIAAEQATGEVVADVTLHFLRTGEEVSVSWNDEVRRRGVEFIDRAIDAVVGQTPLAETKPAT
jgi:ATP-dependent helicase/nuclease subunit A